ncbi:L-Ala-D/L-amino acid epimerase [Selaginella moellendorffii]|uniref:L-Ala-D/L-amino acid epimerase n=1 Tax=Selaginella moellendorffii TaxID=88036 RepID=UPI000D1C64DB|nr:L-Ala-D/L-amino acid epimerase [Selaginella moellendorffii]|eukprot:XP_002973258.2 L-Ala-D/L-amino acid epimerase [Selaginella moellendorffii]
MDFGSAACIPDALPAAGSRSAGSFARNWKISCSMRPGEDRDQHGNVAWRKALESVRPRIAQARARPLDVPLKAPFAIATTKLEAVANVAVRVELADGSVGWGEAPTLFPVTAEDQTVALDQAGRCCRMLEQLEPGLSCMEILSSVGNLLPGHGYASARAGIEMAVIDAAARSVGIPLWKFFGGASNFVTTDITIPICEPDNAARLAMEYAQRGFRTVKTKVGGRDLSSDIAMLHAIRSSHPTCNLILDANEGYTSHEALRVLQELQEQGITPILFEQPVARADWDGLALVSKKARELYGVPVAADESCRSLDDAQRIADEELAPVINVKLAKLGVLGALEVISLAREKKIELMIGGMVETRLGMGFAAHLAAGFGFFRYIDLDTPLLLAEDPIEGGYQVHSKKYIMTDAPGQGINLK